MRETVINIFLIIKNNYVVEFKAFKHQVEGDDYEKIDYLKSRVRQDYPLAESFPAPQNILGQFMRYSKFYRLEEQGMHYQLFEEIFQEFNAPENPLICVTPVVNGEIWDSNNSGEKNERHRTKSN